MAMFLSNQKMNAGFIKPFYKSTNAKNMVKIGPVVSKITHLINQSLEKEIKEKCWKNTYSRPGKHAG